MTQVTEHIWRGKRPTSIQWLVDNGFKVSISLQYGFYDIFHEDEYEHRHELLLSQSSIRFVSLKWSDIFPPTRAQKERLCKLLDYCEANKLKVYVHCAEGVDRTGEGIKEYRETRQGWTEYEAVKEMILAGFHRIRYFYWLPMKYWFRRFG